MKLWNIEDNVRYIHTLQLIIIFEIFEIQNKNQGRGTLLDVFSEFFIQKNRVDLEPGWNL
jgi:hypothetical protein